MASILDAAAGRWPQLLMELGGLAPSDLCEREGPCPSCAVLTGDQGNTRFKWDCDDGPGGWFCSHCGGKDRTGGGGSGLDLLMRVRSWDFKQAVAAVERHLGLPSDTPAQPKPAPKSKGKPHRVPTEPPPNTPPPALGRAVAQYPYGPDRANPWYWIQRVPQPPKTPDGKPQKLFVHRTWLDGAWHYPSKRDPFRSEWPAPRPIYRLPDLIDNPDAPVLIGEGEGKTDDATTLFPDHVCIGWTGGTPGIGHTDWSPLAGRHCVLWPDADDKGRAGMAKLAQILLGLSCSVVVVDPPSSLPQGWDLSNALAEGWTPAMAAKSVANRGKTAELLPEPEPLSTQPPSAPPAPKQQQLLTIADIEDRLRDAIGEGIGASSLAVLVAQLVSASEQPAYAVQRLADAIRSDQAQADAVGAEARQLAAEQDRVELGQVLSTEYLLPATIAAAINIRSRYLPCEGPSAALPFLAAAAGLVKLGTEVEGSAVAGYRVPINLFACLVGRSGAKKSPISRLLVEAPTAELRTELARGNQREREAWEAQCRESKRGESKPLPPMAKRLVVSDFTGEALAAQLQTQESAGLGLLVNRDELSGLFGSLNAYRGGRGADEQQLLELFDGGGLSSLRIVGDRHYNRSQLSIWGSTQPDVLRQLVADGDASGLWARFLFVPLPERAIQLPMASTPAEVAEVEAAAQTLTDVCNAIYRLPRHTYKLSRDAAEAFATYELGRQNAAMKATIGAQSALYGKSAGKVLRVAGILHLLRIATGEAPSGAEISPDTIERASSLVDHLDGWSLGLHAEVAGGGASQLMRTVHRVAESTAGAITWRELSIRLSSKQRKEIDNAAFREAAAALAEAGFGEALTGKRGAISYKALRPLP